MAGDVPLCEQEIRHEFPEHMFRCTAEGFRGLAYHEISPWEPIVGTTVPEANSYPKLCIKPPHADSIAASDSGGSCDFHPPLMAERTRAYHCAFPWSEPIGPLPASPVRASFLGNSVQWFA